MACPAPYPFPGPDVLGRGVVVAPGATTPPGFPPAPRVLIDADALERPAVTADRLHGAWLNRDRVVVELAVDNDRLREPEATDVPPYLLGPAFTFQRERLHFLVWANNYDARGGPPVWWHGELAVRLGAARAGGADVRLPDGTEAWCDGGPREPLPLPTLHRESVGLGRLTPAPTAAPEGPPPGSDGPAADGLAPDQLAAVTHRGGPARIVAPAGSGKTRVLTARLRHLLHTRGIEPELVTAVAYNNRAAAELRDRLAGVPANIRTLHSLGLWVCNLHRRRRTLEEREVRDLLSRIVRPPRLVNTDPLAPYLEALADVRLGLKPPEVVAEERDDIPGFVAAFDRYREALAERDAVDFDEQIYGAVEALLADPELRRRVQRTCTHLLVDEFQDLTPAFVLLVRLAAAPAFQVFGVGDDDQTIYGHAGADPRFLLGYAELFPGAAFHALEVNYRCPAAVVTAATRLLAHNRRRVHKTIRAHPSPPPAPDATDGRAPLPALETHHTAPAAMAARTVDLLGAWHDEGRAWAGLAVLARVNASLLAVQVACVHAGIPTTAPLEPGVLTRTGTRAALAYLRIALDPTAIRREDLVETVRRPSRKLPRDVLHELRRRRHWALDDVADLADEISGRVGGRLADYVADVAGLADAVADGADTARCLHLVRTRIGLAEAVEALDGSRTRLDGSSHGDDLDALEQVAALHPDPATFHRWLADSLAVGGRPDGVTLSSIHRVKGREWDRVVVYAANAGLMPHRLAEEVEEERRVFHVAITRCRERVAVVCAAGSASPFVDELAREAPPRRDPPPADLLRAPPPAHAARRPLAGDDPRPESAALFAALKRWRLETARAGGVPAYVVMNDRELMGIAERRPRSEAQLRRCPGVGPVRLERYGDEILAVVAAHEEESGPANVVWHEDDP